MASPFAARHAAPGQPDEPTYTGRHRAILAHDVREDPETGEPLPAGVYGFPVGGRGNAVRAAAS